MASPWNTKIHGNKKQLPEELKVFISTRESTCGECKENLGTQAWIFLRRDKGAFCLACADLDHLVFLESGDAALTRRARKHSALSAVVLKWSRNRKRYERQGLLVESQALEKAEAECLADSEVRKRRHERASVRREELDQQYVEQFSRRIQVIFPGCPAGRERAIAEHACLKYSGRVGRAAFAKKLDEEAIRLAVIAHLRHTETDYDEYLMRGYERGEARDLVREKIGQNGKNNRTKNFAPGLPLTLAGGAFSFQAGCSREDVHQAAARLIPRETLREMGLQIWERFRSQFPPSRNAALQRRLQAIGVRVVRAAKGNPEEWEFAVFRGDPINAFAVPGGKVGFFEGMFSAAKNDAQIGAVLGHEIGHLNARHPEERIMAAFAKQVGIAVVLAALQTGDVNYANEIAGLLGVGLEYGIIRPYSRRQELEADRLGVEYLARSGYPAGEAVAFWTHMMALGRSRPQPPSFLATHPSDEKRIEALKQVLGGLWKSLIKK